MSVIPLPAGHGQGTVPPRSRKNTGDSASAEHWKSSALLTIQDVADHCKVSYWTARGWIESGKLPVVRLPGRLVRVRPTALERFLAECGS